jgi:hypothetical protein
MIHVIVLSLACQYLSNVNNYLKLSRAVGKFCSFGFAKGRLVCRAKPNVQNAGGIRITFLNAGGEKF